MLCCFFRSFSKNFPLGALAHWDINLPVSKKYTGGIYLAASNNLLNRNFLVFRKYTRAIISLCLTNNLHVSNKTHWGIILPV